MRVAFKVPLALHTVTNGGFACRARGEGGNVCVCGIARLKLNARMRERGSGKVSMRVNWR